MRGIQTPDDDVFYLFLQKQKIGAELHIYLEEGTYHKRLFRESNTNDMKKTRPHPRQAAAAAADGDGAWEARTGPRPMMMLPFICSYRNKNEPTAIYPSLGTHTDVQ
jgi:hypothetical protein